MQGSLLSLFLAALGYLLSGCNGYPTGLNNTLDRRQCVWNEATGDFDCNQWMPNLAQLVHRMRDPSWKTSAQPGVLPFFYSNLVPPGELNDRFRKAEVLQWCIDYLVKMAVVTDFYWHENVFDSAGNGWIYANHEHLAEIIDDPDIKAITGGSVETGQHYFLGCYDQALALAAQHHTVYFFTRFDQEPLEESAWNEAEFWPLTREGGIVQNIFRVDPRPYSEYLSGQDNHYCDPPILLWSRVRDEPRPPLFTCPFTHDDGSVPNLPDPWAPEPQAPEPPELPEPPEDPPIESRAAKLKEEQALQTSTVKS